MAQIHGMPMIGHCYLRTQMCEQLLDTYVATCDQEIFDYIESIGGKAIMTANTHERATDRTAEAMLKAEEQLGERVDIVVMVQGDEPMVVPEMISEAITPIVEDEDIHVVNLMANMKSVGEFENPNEVKVVVDLNSNALYFSREPIPSKRKGVSDVPMLKQVCIIPFRRDYLLQFNEMPETGLERIESVDMMRILETGGNVHMVMTEHESFSVDTEQDLENVAQHMKSDILLGTYSTV